MKAFFLALCLVFLPSVAGDVFTLHFHYANGTLYCDGYSEQNGFPDDYRLFPENGTFGYALVAQNGTVLDSFSFDAPLGYFYDEFNASGRVGGGYRELENASFSLNARRLQGARISISKAGKTLCLYDVPTESASEEPTIPTLETTPTMQPAVRNENGASTTLILVLLLIGIAVFAYEFATKKIRA